MLSVSCPGCGAPVEFKSHASALAVCAFCRTSVVRDDDTLRQPGKLSAVLEDYSPIQLGAAGRYGTHDFTVIGRIQLRYDAGLWNEWFLLFDDGSTGWLGDASGAYTVTIAQGVDVAALSFKGIQPGNECMTQNGSYVVADKRTARCIGGEGELPFVVGDGWEARVVDLRRGAEFATLDYSDGPQPMLYKGAVRTLEQLRCQLLRDDETIKASAGRYRGRVTALACPKCGASISYLPGVTANVVCQSCRSELDASTPAVQVLRAGEEGDRHVGALALGSKGRISGRTYTVLGVMSRADDDGERWNEYLLYQERGGFLWLTEYGDEWWRASAMDEWPVRDGGHVVRLNNTAYEQAASYTARVEYVSGAFNWRVSAGDTARVVEYESGKVRLTAELTGEELVWSQAASVSAAQVALWFGLTSKPAGAGKTAPDDESTQDMGTHFLLWMLGLNVIPLFLNYSHVWPWLLIGMVALLLPVHMPK
jgi:ribosomal protein S27E